MNKITFPLKLKMKGPAVADLQAALQLLIDEGVIVSDDADALKRERAGQTYGSVTRKLVSIFQETHQLQVSGAVDEASANAINALLREGGQRKPERTIEGRILLEHGLPAEKLKLRLYRLDFGGKATLLNETTTVADGEYVFSYDSGGKAASLEVRAVKGANEEITLSKPLNDLSAESRAGLNLIAPGALQPLAAEYQRLSADLTPHVGQMSKLVDARENAERQDLTVLNRATGWDARLIALATVTERLSADAEVKLPQEAVYGLLRAGLPSDKLLLAQIEPDVAEQALKNMRDAGIVALDDAQIEKFKKAFTTFSNAVRLNIPAPGSHSTYGALLKTSGLPQNAQDKFVPIYLNHRGDAAQLWDEARKAGLDDAQVGKLQLQGKFAFLAGNSEAMVSALMNKRINDPEQLVEGDFHQAAQWKAEVIALAGNDEKKLNALIPERYADEKVEDRLDAYSEDMARKVRLSYPTQVIGRMIETDDKFKPLAAHADTVTLLKNAAQKGFRLGETPVAAFLKANPGVTADIAAQKGLQALQRVYQITPSNEAMPVLMSLDMTSAYDVMAYSEATFTELFNAKYLEIHKVSPVLEMAKLVYRKVKQVSSVTYNLFTIAKTFESEPPVAGMSASVEVRESVRNELIKHFPTMESLFGSMDFCECEHCRSVLSPAAYLVDLLQFVDAEPGVWGNFLAHWRVTHGGQQYTAKYKKPYDALIERRPDLPHIPLTCENTHTALPYIDIVNEILEYYVANGKLEEEAAHDTGEATTAELLAEPQNVIRGAYDKLRKARYPLNLPFDLWIETVRQFCNYFETPLDRILETLRKSDTLLAPAQAFDRANVFMESLGLSPTEAAIFTNPNPLSKWHELYGFETAAQALTEATDATTGQRIDLNSAKALSRRLGVTYKEIAEIVQTGFVNPKPEQRIFFHKLGVTTQHVIFYKDNKSFYEQNQDLIGKDRSSLSTTDRLRFDALSTKDPKTQKIGWENLHEVQAFELRRVGLTGEFNVPLEQVEAELQAIPLNGVLVLADPDAGCSFDLTTLRYANGNPADAIAFLRINLFVRLWRKLGWSIEETDRALQAFVPKNAPFETAHLNKQPLKTALIYLAHLKVLNEKVRVGKQSRIKLITLWSDINTTGKKPLYAQLFLTRSVLKIAPVFDHPLGRYLSVAGVKLKDHVLALQGALGLTADEIGRILVDAGISIDTTGLSLPNVSLLYRYGLLAKALKVSVRELIALKQLSGLDPFKLLQPNPVTTLDEDYPFTQTLRFVDVAEEVKESGLKIEDLEYLLRHRFDETGNYRPDREGTLALLKTLAEGIRAIQAEHAVPDDAGALSEEVLRQKLGLALTPDVVERFLAMMSGTVEFTATKTGVAAVNQLDAQAFEGEAAIRQVSYNAARQEQKLTFRSVLFDAQKTALQTNFDAALTAPQKLAFAELLGGVKTLAREFFDNQLKKQKLRLDDEAGFLEDGDFSSLFLPLKPLKKILSTDTQQEIGDKQIENENVQRENLTELQLRRNRTAQAFLPFLQQRLMRQFIVQTMTAYTGADAALVESLVIDERLLATAGTQALLGVFAATAERGLTATFFASADGSGAALTTLSLADANTGLKDKDGNPLKPAGADSARLEGYLEAPTPGAYRFYVALDKQNAGAELRFAHLAKPTLTGTASNDNDEVGDGADEYVELKPGIPYRFTLDLRKLNGGEARLLVQGETLAKDRLAQLALYPSSAMESGERAIVLLTKALQLVQSLGLNEREIRYMLTHAAAFDGLSFSQLPTRSSDDTPVGAKALFEQFLRVAAYARLKRDLADGTDDLIGIFEANETTDADKLDQKVYPLVAKLTRRDEATVKASAEALFAAPTFASEKPLQRLWEALQIVERFGVPVASLLDWTRIVSASSTPAQRFDIARDLKEAIKARFEPETWQRVAQPIFDKLRQRQRDALVSHVMHQHGFDRMEQLYEYFLIDPGMEPVVQTSRIRLAIASLQLFIQRCLLNLELKVHPSVITSKQWEWMKRYRVWEANRKIFLFPENWLEPEFRDDKTHLFTELEGALLQGDVSSDLVEDAFLNYLKKLDELARLDIVAMHVQDDPNPAGRTLHVIGRTYSQPHKYFYRRYAHQMWTPWEPVSAEIEGDHLAPVIWRDRLYLFWVTFMDKPVENPQPSGTAADSKLTDLTLKGAISGMQAVVAYKKIEIQLHWSEYLQGGWSTRESGGYSNVISRTVPASFKPSSVYIHVSKAYDAGEERGVYITLGGWIRKSFYLAGRNSTPVETNDKAKPRNPYNVSQVRATRYVSNGSLTVTFRRHIVTKVGKWTKTFFKSLELLPIGKKYTLLPCNNDITLGGAPTETQDTDKFEAVDQSPFEILSAVDRAIAAGLPEIASLIKPVFYQNSKDTFFVEPNVTERTIEEWTEWLPRSSESEWRIPDTLKEIVVIAETPWNSRFLDPRESGYLPIDSAALINLKSGYDWLVNPVTGLRLDDEVIGSSGRVGMVVLPSHEASEVATHDALLVNIPIGGDFPAGSVAVVPSTLLDQAGITTAAGGLNVVGGAGFNSTLAQNANELNTFRFTAGRSDAGRTDR